MLIAINYTKMELFSTQSSAGPSFQSVTCEYAG